jgi:hypothetical protein
MRNRQVTARTKHPARRMIRCEIVRIASPALLIDGQMIARRYEPPDGEPLAPGYYLALWPAGANHASFGAELCYLGPLENLAAARLLKTSALGLGIVEQAQTGAPRRAGPPPASLAVPPRWRAAVPREAFPAAPAGR